MPPLFGDRLSKTIARCGNCLCVGLDPHVDLLPSELGARSDDLQSDDTATAVSRFLSVVIEECAGLVPIVKPQIALFEQLGWRGMRVLEEVVALAARRGLLVLLDAKRGDVGSTAEAYARAYLTSKSACKVDAITLNPYLGRDSLEPFVACAREYGVGLFVLAKTSNSGSGEFQDRACDGRPLFLHVADALKPWADELTGETGWSSIGVVAGATYPAQAAALREVLPQSFLLMPGVDFQGASQVDLRKSGLGSGVLFSSSRGVLFGSSRDGEDWRSALRGRIKRAVWDARHVPAV